MATAAPITSSLEASPVSGRQELVEQENVLSVEGVTKRFGELVALEDVSFSVRRGEVHCLLGENGAGKSTLCNLIFGVHRPDSGRFSVDGARFEPRDPAHALRAGVAMVHQHFSLVGPMTTLENLALGRRAVRALELRARTEELCRRFGFELDLEKPVEELSVGARQRVEVIKCLLGEPRLLVLDEPTAVLPPSEVASLLETCRRVADAGCGVVLVTHKLAEVAQVADRITVLRHGRVVESVPRVGADLRALVRAMVGRELGPLAEAERREPSSSAEELGVPALELESLTHLDVAGQERLRVSLRVGRGEIVGVAGVEGNGQSELAAILSGMLAPASGRILVAGEDVTGLAPRELTRRGVGCVTEDRHATGCHVGLSVAENLFLGSLSRFSRFGLLDRARLRKAAAERLAAFDVRGAPDSKMGALSGGNQQKVVLSRELSLNPLVFLLAAHPTRGLDLGAIEAVYAAIRRARDAGTGALVISSELEELLQVADRVIVLYRGRIVGEVRGGSAQQELVGALMSGQSPEEARRLS
jgi:simple sugar transport system ATP-binding protein